MLILSRRVGESIRIGVDIQITCLRIRGNQVSLGIQAPAEVTVDREEVYLVKLARGRMGATVSHAGATITPGGTVVPRTGTEPYA